MTQALLRWRMAQNQQVLVYYNERHQISPI